MNNLNDLYVLIVEDSENDTELLVHALREGGFNPVYQRVETEEEMQQALRRVSWDLIISDYDMPFFSAPEALALYLKSGLEIPFIVVSGAISEEAGVVAMKAGAHDYISKRNLSRLLPAVLRELRDAANRRELYQAEKERQQQEKDFKNLSENNPDILVRFNGNYQVVYANPAITRETGVTRELLLGKTVEELGIAEKSAITWKQALQDAFEHGEIKTIYFDYGTPSELKNFQSYVVPEFAPDKTIESVLTITRNVTEIKNKE